MKQQKSMIDLWKDSYLSGGNDAYLEDLYETYLKSPNEVAPEWRDYFGQLELGQTYADVSHNDVRHFFSELSKKPLKISSSENIDLNHARQQENVIDLI